MNDAIATLGQFWNQRYAAPEFAYGTAPNDFLVAQQPRMAPGGQVLCVADGEGRNGVWLAQQGYDVTSVDLAEQGMAKAAALARERGVGLRTAVADVTQFDLGTARWDAIVSIFLHLPRALRQAFHARCLAALKPGGVLILEVYGDLQSGRGTGGPREPELLPAYADVAADFAQAELLHAWAGERAVLEGRFHTGPGYVLQFVVQSA